MASTFPGAQFFGPGRSNKFITELGTMLIKRGGGRFYKVGAGPTWSDADRNATRTFQKAQGWTGADADGLPGPKTWELLATGKGRDIPPASPASPSSASGTRVKSPVPGHDKGFKFGVKDKRYKAGFHTGQDWPAPGGARIVAVRNGEIVKVRHDIDDYGTHVVLKAENERDYWYCHLSKVLVTKGQPVLAGDTLGHVGRTGKATGNHLHMEDRPRNGRYGQVRDPIW